MTGWFSWECDQCHACCSSDSIAELMAFEESHASRHAVEAE